MQYGCGLCNSNHRIILCMIITIEQKIFEKLPFEELAIPSKAIDFRAADFEHFLFEQLHSSNLSRFNKCKVMVNFVMVFIFNRFNLKEIKAIKDNVVLLRITEGVQSALPQLQCKC
jgi:hypothetical protein